MDLRTRGAVVPTQAKDHRLQFIGGKGMCRETRWGIRDVSSQHVKPVDQLALRKGLHNGLPETLSLSELLASGETGNDGQVNRLRKSVHAPFLVFQTSLIEYDSPYAVTAPFIVANTAQDVVSGIESHELAGGYDVDDLSVFLAQRNGKSATYYVTQDVV
jgi:hypothetical protein